jgi:uncharacterized protein YuzE
MITEYRKKPGTDFYVNTVRYDYEADVVYISIEGNIFRVWKDKTDAKRAGNYVSHGEVMADLNESSLKVSIFKEGMSFVHANFDIEEEEEK